VLFTGILAVSTASILIRLAEAPALIIAAYRLTIASLILAPVAFYQAGSELRRLTRRRIGLGIAAGVFLALHFATWITSLGYTSVASSVVFVATSPLWVGIVSHFVLRERVGQTMAFGIAFAVIGGIIIGFGDLGIGPRELFGDFLALLGALAGSGYFLTGRTLRRDLSLIAYIFLAYSAAAVLLVAFAALAGQSFGGYSPQTYLVLVLLAVVPQIIGHSSFNWALKYLTAVFVTVAALGEPIGATILAYFVLSEVPTLTKLIGGTIILAGIYLASRAEREKTIMETTATEL
jgi:drug/metabolite transporter (DMT)-like permease